MSTVFNSCSSLINFKIPRAHQSLSKKKRPEVKISQGDKIDFL
jgi:hypothetical protein